MRNCCQVQAHFSVLKTNGSSSGPCLALETALGYFTNSSLRLNDTLQLNVL